MITWYDHHSPHLVAGGKHDGHIVTYFGAPKEPEGFNYCMPGVFTFAPMYMDCEAMVPLTADQANAITAARKAANQLELDRPFGRQEIRELRDLIRKSRTATGLDAHLLKEIEAAYGE